MCYELCIDLIVWCNMFEYDMCLVVSISFTLPFSAAPFFSRSPSHPPSSSLVISLILASRRSSYIFLALRLSLFVSHSSSPSLCLRLSLPSSSTLHLPLLLFSSLSAFRCVHKRVHGTSKRSLCLSWDYKVPVLSKWLKWASIEW